MQTKDYSDCQTFHLEPQWYSPAVASLIANPPVVEFLEELCGPEIIFTRVDLPAPFSPNSACIFFDSIFRLIFLFALTEPNCFDIFDIFNSIYLKIGG